MAKNFLAMNEWSFSGEVFYLKELGNEYGASLKIRGVSESGFGQKICELSCLMPNRTYKEALSKGVCQYRHVALSGHMETFVKKERQKTMFIADYILEVA